MAEGRQVCGGGLNTKTFVDVKLPDFGSPCYSQEELLDLLNTNFLGATGSATYSKQPYAMQLVEEDFLKDHYCCTGYTMPVGRSRNDYTCVDEDIPDVAESIPADHGPAGFYFSPTGELIWFSEPVLNPNWYEKGTYHPKGALLSFRKGDKTYKVHTDETFQYFKGYKSIDAETKLYPFTKQSYQANSEVQVHAGLYTNNCQSSVFVFDYSPTISSSASDGQGGIGKKKEEHLVLDFNPKKMRVEPYQNGYNGVSTPEIYEYYGNQLGFYAIDHARAAGLECPSIAITPGDLAALDAKKIKFYDNGSYVQDTDKGIFYFQLNDQAEFDLFLYHPDRKLYVYFTPMAWTTPSDVFDVVSDEIITVITDEHIILEIIAATEVPVISQLADLTNGAIYLSEGETGEVILCLAGIGLGSKLAYDALSNIQYLKFGSLKKIFKNGPDHEVNEVALEALQDYSKGLNLTEDHAGILKNYLKNDPVFAQRCMDKPQTMGAWKYLEDAGVITSGNNLTTEQLDLIAILADDLENVSDLEGFFRGVDGVTNIRGAKAWKKFLDDGLPPAFRRNITNLKQRSLIDEWAGNIAAASNKRKGNFGEIGADLDLNSKGCESLIGRIDDIDAGGHNGLDGVFIKDGNYYIVEGKYSGSAQINGAVPPNLPRQMSDDWIATRSWDEFNLDQNIIDDLLENKNYERILAKTAPDGTVTYSKIDADGYEISGSVWNP